jgi:hypothetical protein
VKHVLYIREDQALFTNPILHYLKHALRALPPGFRRTLPTGWKRFFRERLHKSRDGMVIG